MSTDIETHVEELFASAPDRKATLRENPVTRERFVPGDPIRPHKARAVRALTAQAWFAKHKPTDAPDLPVNYDDREQTRWNGDGLSYLVGALGRSIHGRDFRTEGHPDFDTFARGVMASPLTPDFVRDDPELQKRFPPKLLPGLGNGLVWRRPR